MEGLELRTFTSFDGTEIVYQVAGPKDAPVVVFANGLGGRFHTWKHVYDALSARHRIISWDYRGLFSSERPDDLTKLDVPFHARDLEALLAHERVDAPVILCGWSMGAQVVLEFYKQKLAAGEGWDPALRLPAGFVILNGCASLPARTASTVLAVTAGASPFLGALGLLQRFSSADRVRKVVLDLVVPVLIKARVVAPTIDRRLLCLAVEDLATVNLVVLNAIAGFLARHDASDAAHRVAVPTLVLAGERDFIVPPSASRRCHEEIRGSSFTVIEDAGHWALIERPDVVVAAIRRALQISR